MAIALLGLTLLDELWGGVLSIDAAGVEDDYGLAHGGTSALLLSLPILAGALVETKILLALERRDRRPPIAIAQLIIGVCAAVAACASSPWLLACALAVAGPAGGVACGLGQVALVESHPSDGARERALTAWTLAGELGDFGAPALVALVGVLGGSWRVALLAAAALLIAHGLFVWRSPIAGAVIPEEDDDDAPPRKAPRTLWIWLAATASCALLDEILVVLASLHLIGDLGMSASHAAACLGASSIGGALGLLVTRWALARMEGRRLLAVTALACALACAAWPWAASPVAAAVWLFALGFTASPLYPLCSARAYAVMPDRPAFVAAAGNAFIVLDVALPWLLGLLADACGLRVALTVLVVQPLLTLIALWLTRLKRSRRSSPRARSRSR